MQTSVDLYKVYLEKDHVRRYNIHLGQLVPSIRQEPYKLDESPNNCYTLYLSPSEKFINYR